MGKRIQLVSGTRIREGTAILMRRVAAIGGVISTSAGRALVGSSVGRSFSRRIW